MSNVVKIALIVAGVAGLGWLVWRKVTTTPKAVKVAGGLDIQIGEAVIEE